VSFERKIKLQKESSGTDYKGRRLNGDLMGRKSGENSTVHRGE
jgi:hypothetical protein